MTDLEKVKRCAERMGYRIVVWNGAARVANEDGKLDDDESPFYDPLTNKAQAFELVERLRLRIEAHGNEPDWYWAVFTADYDGDGGGLIAHDADLCRAIVEAVAQIPDDK